MQLRVLMVLTVMLASLAACKPDSDAGKDALAKDEAGEVASSDVASAGRGAPGAEVAGTAPGGAFAREPGFQLPVPVSNAPVQMPGASRSRQIDAAGVTSAVLEGLEGTSSNVQVRVNPGGIVSLSGEVETIAQLQRAHYLARAQPGVVEVDYRNLRVRQR